MGTAIRNVILLSACLLLAGCALPGRGTKDGGSSPLAPPGVISLPFLNHTPRFATGLMQPGDWDRAWTTNGTFDIEDGSKAQGQYPFRVWMGVNQSWLFVALNIPNISVNPWSNWSKPDAWPDDLVVFITPGYSGPLGPDSEAMSFAHIWRDGMIAERSTWD